MNAAGAVPQHTHGPADPTLAGYCQECGTTLELRWQEDRDRPTCPACGFIRYLDPKVAVVVIVGDERGIWLGKRNISPARGMWSFPAGYVNRGEVLEEAATREVREEMGVEARLLGLVGAYSSEGEAVIVIAYAGDIVSGEARPDGREVSEVRRFPLDALPPLAFNHDGHMLNDWRRVAGVTASLVFDPARAG